MTAGPRWCTSPKRQHADVWMAIWTILEDVGVGAVTFKKLNAHQSRAAKQRQDEEMQVAIAANREADRGPRGQARRN